MSDQNVEQPSEGVKTRGDRIAHQIIGYDPDKEKERTVIRMNGVFIETFGITVDDLRSWLASIIDAACAEAVAEQKEYFIAGLEITNHTFRRELALVVFPEVLRIMGEAPIVHTSHATAIVAVKILDDLIAELAKPK